MLETQAYLTLVRRRGEAGLELSRVYRNMRRRDLFLLAYANLYANNGATTPGIDPQDIVFHKYTCTAFSVASFDNVRWLFLRGTGGEQEAKYLSHDTIFLTRWSNVWPHVLSEPARILCDEKRGEELFPISKTRANSG